MPRGTIKAEKENPMPHSPLQAVPSPQAQLDAYHARVKEELARPQEHVRSVSSRHYRLLTEAQEKVLGFIAFERDYMPNPDEEYLDPFL